MKLSIGLELLIIDILSYKIEFFELLAVFDHILSTSEPKTTKFGPVLLHLCPLGNWFWVFPLFFHTVFSVNPIIRSMQSHVLFFIRTQFIRIFRLKSGKATLKIDKIEEIRFIIFLILEEFCVIEVTNISSSPKNNSKFR